MILFWTDRQSVTVCYFLSRNIDLTVLTFRTKCAYLVGSYVILQRFRTVCVFITLHYFPTVCKGHCCVGPASNKFKPGGNTISDLRKLRSTKSRENSKFYVHGSVHRESMSVSVQQDGLYTVLLYFCRQLYMFRMISSSIIRSTLKM